jgi:bud site selection protein 31
MARIKTRRSKAPPEGYDILAPTLTKLLTRLAEAQSASLIKEDKHSSLWPIIQINHQISRYIYIMYYKRKLISKELYDYLLTQNYVDADLIAKWKKTGYENLCCVRCIVTAETNHGNTCICRVPKSTLIRNGQEERVECITCGCKGCASTD